MLWPSCSQALFRTFLKAETDFGMRMLRESSINETCVVSPVSVILALAALQVGAKGLTKTQISRAISDGEGFVRSVIPETVRGSRSS